MEKLKTIQIRETDYNILTHIAQLEKFTYAEGTKYRGTMIAWKAVEHVLKVYAGAMA